MSELPAEGEPPHGAAGGDPPSRKPAGSPRPRGAGWSTTRRLLRHWRGAVAGDRTLPAIRPGPADRHSPWFLLPCGLREPRDRTVPRRELRRARADVATDDARPGRRLANPTGHHPRRSSSETRCARRPSPRRGTGRRAPGSDPRRIMVWLDEVPIPRSAPQPGPAAPGTVPCSGSAHPCPAGRRRPSSRRSLAGTRPAALPRQPPRRRSP